MIKTKEYHLKNLNILYEDNHVLVVEKPINVLSQKDYTNDIDMNDIIKQYLKEKYDKPGNVYLGLIHRLDRRVGGVMVFAKTSKAAKRLSEDIKKHNFEKTYLVCVKGKLLENQTLELRIKKDEQQKIAIIADDGKHSKLDYKIINYINNNTYAVVNLITGRYNQIRVSFAHIGHPLINDYKYDPLQSQTKEDLGLWCYKIGFTHPVTKEYHEFILYPQSKIWNECKIKKQSW